jgi:glutamate 5-kinase
MTQTRQARMRQVKRVVVKIGSSSLTTRSNKLNRRVLRKLVTEVVALRQQGIEVAIVTSGAVAAGMGRLGLETRPRMISELQAVAAVGQNLLMHAYETLFKKHDVPIGQVLLSAEDILDERRHALNLENAFHSLFAFGAVPVINENDSVAVAELERPIGENDMLAAFVGNLIQAQLLVILSDIEGVYANYRSNHAKGELIGQIAHGDPRLDDLVSDVKSRHGRGGMKTKIEAARLRMACGEMSVIAHARQHSLVDILAGEDLGTLFVPGQKRLKSRQRWIAFTAPKGRVVIDRGAESALVEHNKSLLPAGIISCRGNFIANDTVRVTNEANEELGRGLSRYTSEEIVRIRGKSSASVTKLLGRPAPEVVHRDDLVLFTRNAAPDAEQN